MLTTEEPSRDIRHSEVIVRRYQFPSTAAAEPSTFWRPPILDDVDAVKEQRADVQPMFDHVAASTTSRSTAERQQFVPDCESSTTSNCFPSSFHVGTTVLRHMPTGNDGSNETVDDDEDNDQTVAHHDVIDNFGYRDDVCESESLTRRCMYNEYSSTFDLTTTPKPSRNLSFSIDAILSPNFRLSNPPTTRIGWYAMATNIKTIVMIILLIIQCLCDNKLTTNWN